MLNIKEIALQLAHRKCTRYNHVPVDHGIRYNFSDAHLIDLAEALIAELSKQNEPVGYLRSTEKVLVFMSLAPVKDGTYFYTFPPTAEQIANETAEACAKACEDVIGNTPHDQRMLAAIDCAVMLRSGAWKEFNR